VAAERISDFRRWLQRAAADRTLETPNGTGIISDSVPDVYDANYLSVEAPTVSAGDLAADADAVLETSHHRRVIVEDGAPGVADDFAQLGFDRSTHLVLAHTGKVDRRVDTNAVREVTLGDLAPLRADATLREPWGDADLAAQLNDAKRLFAAAVPTRFFAAIVDGAVAGWCELRRRGGVSQIEDVEVLEELRGRGLGRAVVQHALDAGQQAGDLVFLEALADDWPRELYAKLGFTIVGRRDVYTQLPGPLTRLRLRTPRLELRVATRAEARRLFAIAEAAIHEEVDDFIAQVTGSTPNSVRFAAFLDGAPVGVQALDVQPEWVTTSSWLGATYEGDGLGAEMRAAALTYAFDVRQAAVARSEHSDVELRRDRFRSPVPVTVDGVRPLA
jgi:ribosomal protein S18 acetylase RimI-like enzyme